jgi:hypothetical protein
MQAAAGLPGSLSGAGQALADVQGEIKIREGAVGFSEVVGVADQLARVSAPVNRPHSVEQGWSRTCGITRMHPWYCHRCEGLLPEEPAVVKIVMYVIHKPCEGEMPGFNRPRWQQAGTGRALPGAIRA